MELTFAQKENIGFRYILDAMRPCSPYGTQRLRELTPMGPADRQQILRQLGNIRRLLDAQANGLKPAPMQRLLMGLKMIRPTVIKGMDTDLNEIELFELKRFLLQWQEIYRLLRSDPAWQLEGITPEDTEAALDILDPERNRVASFYIPDSLSPTLSALRQEKRALEIRLREETDPALSARRSQVAGEEELELQRIQSRMSQTLRPFIPAILANMDAIADLDLTLEKARLAKLYGGTEPRLTDNVVDMQQMVNPRIADLLAAQNKAFTPISIRLEQGATVITGANMGGKSVALKTIALNILLVHCGFFPFARSAALPLFDGLHIISEDLESVDRGLSSFGGEMVRFNRTAGALEQGFHFLLLDEFARGTNPHEGAAIVRAVTGYLNRQNAISVLATHYDHVAEVACAHYQVAGLKDVNWDAFQKELGSLSGEDSAQRIVRSMNYGLYRVEGRQDCPRDALHICRLLGMAPEIVEDAEKTVSAALDFC